MKTLKITLLLAAFLLLLPAKSNAQNQLVWVHDDHVKPAMQEQYTKLAKELADACKQYNIQNTDWIMIRLSNGVYRYVSTIPNLAALDVNPFKALGEKMGKEKLATLFENMDKCYDKHNSFINSNVKELTYMPDGYSINTPGLNFRKHHYFYVTPSTSDAVAEKMKAVHALYVKNKAKEYFQIYHSSLGCEEEYYLVVVSAKDEADYQKTSDETEKLLGDEGAKAMDALFKATTRYEVTSGYAKQDLSYFAKK
ncbi:MAG: hypothetical protein EOO50_11355 [Flavobacterium sp.]|uniref:hypothetical protein n=1 Tax=Flavobacterium sp. TaxID=239 RepID=UPI0012072BA5|nr:hypothetical protein [Flavobacterium sp.]RZJ66002.1 MAG: hypothetical protein EOO50_11355 [Flavobacterium sp.]